MKTSKRLPEILKSILTDGIEGALLMTTEGSVLSSDFISTSGNINETSLAAISSSIWNNYTENSASNAELTCFISRYENGVIALAQAGKGYVVVIYGSKVTTGLIKGRVDGLSQYFQRIFEQLK